MNMDELRFHSMISDLEHVNFHKLTAEELVCLDQVLIQANQKSKDEFTAREMKHKGGWANE